MTERFSNEINQGLRIKQALREKFENIMLALTTRLENHLRYEQIPFKNFKEIADHFTDGGWSGTSIAIFIFNDGWNLELNSGNYVKLKNDKLNFLVKSGEFGGTRYYPPVISTCPDSVTKLYEIDRTLHQLLLNIYKNFIPLQAWFDDLKVRG